MSERMVWLRAIFALLCASPHVFRSLHPRHGSSNPHGPDARGTLRDQAASRTLLRAMSAVIVIRLLGLPSFSSANCLYPFKPFQGSVMKS